jgi:hypothetical protein
MKSIYLLPVVAAFAVLSVAVRAQSNAVATGATAAQTLVAEVDSPAMFSSSVDSSLSVALPAALPAGAGMARSAAAAAAVGSTSSGGSTRPFSSLGIGVKIGTVGIGFDAAVPLVPGRLNLRGGAGFFSYNSTFTASSDNILGTLKLNNAEVMADWFPFHGSFRLSGGATIFNATALNGTISIPSGGTLTNGGDKYYSDPAAPLGGTAAFTFGSSTVPRFTLGWGNMVPKTGHHIRFETEFGVEYIGNPTVLWNVTGQGCTTTATPGATLCTGPNGTSVAWGPVAPADIAAQQANLQNDVNGLKVFPVLSIGLSYKIH